jgi:hypothetical protein
MPQIQDPAGHEASPVRVRALSVCGSPSAQFDGRTVSYKPLLGYKPRFVRQGIQHEVRIRTCLPDMLKNRETVKRHMEVSSVDRGDQARP